MDRLYAFAEDLGATVVRTTVSRTVIDVNRDPSGASLYPGQATTALCPETTFDGEGTTPGSRDVTIPRAGHYFLGLSFSDACVLSNYSLTLSRQ